MFIELLGFSRPLAIKCVSMSNQLCLARPTSWQKL